MSPITDLLLVHGSLFHDPLADIHAMDAVEFVMKQGTVYKK